VDVGAALVAGAEPLEGVQPGEAALGHPPLAAQAGAVGDAAAGAAQRDAACPQLLAVDVVAVAAVGEQLPRSPAGASASAPDRWNGVDQWDELGTSWRLPPVTRTASGMPLASQIRWCLEPGRPRLTGDGPTWSPFQRADMGAVDRAPVQLQLAEGAQLSEQQRLQGRPARRGHRSANPRDGGAGAAWAVAAARPASTARQGRAVRSSPTASANPPDARARHAAPILETILTAVPPQ
jgi:hypothetical protein